MSDEYQHLAEVPAVKAWLEDVSHQVTLKIREYPELLTQAETIKH
jgi:hypothetical protein